MCSTEDPEKGPIFDNSDYYSAFERLLDLARAKRPMRIIAYHLMLTHFHFLLWPEGDRDTARFMQWLTGTHAQRWHLRRNSSGCGAVYQARYKSVLVKNDRQYFTVWRYIERNAVTAGLMKRAEDWPWCSASQGIAPERTFSVDPGPLPRLDNWIDVLNT
ncbi:MAG: transposase [Vicinamibacterales bacterium]